MQLQLMLLIRLRLNLNAGADRDGSHVYVMDESGTDSNNPHIFEPLKIILCK